jgi:hypothetical protein
MVWKFESILFMKYIGFYTRLSANSFNFACQKISDEG